MFYFAAQMLEKVTGPDSNRYIRDTELEKKMTERTLKRKNEECAKQKNRLNVHRGTKH